MMKSYALRIRASLLFVVSLIVGLPLTTHPAYAAGYYSGPALVRNCLSIASRLDEDCRFSFEVGLEALTMTRGRGCLAAHGIRTANDVRRLVKRYARSRSESEIGENVVFDAFEAIFDEKRCPDPGREAVRAAQDELRILHEAAAAGDVDAQLEVALRTYGDERKYWLCVAANHGSAPGQYEYGRALELYDSDYAQAYIWYRRAENKRYYLARDARIQVAEKLDPGLIPELNQRVDVLGSPVCNVPQPQ